MMTIHGITSPLSPCGSVSASVRRGRRTGARILPRFLLTFCLAFITMLLPSTAAYAVTVNDVWSSGITVTDVTMSSSSVSMTWTHTAGSHNYALWGMTAGSYEGTCGICVGSVSYPAGSTTATVTGSGLVGMILYDGCSAVLAFYSSTLSAATMDSRICAHGTPYPTIAAVPSPAPTGTGNTCVLTDVALVRLARGAGFTETTIQAAVAIALAESGGHVDALHYNGPAPGSWDIGLWQINDVAHSTYNRDTLFTSPGYNAAAAYAIYSAGTGGGFGNWSTYTSGAYNAFMSRAASALSQGSVGTLGGNSCTDMSGGDIANGLDSAGTTNSDGSDNGCGFSLNLFKSLKCALTWAFVPSDDTFTSWQSQIDDITGNPPISTVTEGYALLSDVYTGFNADTNQAIGLSATDCDTTTCQGTGLGVGTMPTPFRVHEDSGDVDIPLLQRIGDDMHGTTLGNGIYLLMQLSITAVFGLYWYQRFTGSIGAKT